jgi:hypothetical protein
MNLLKYSPFFYLFNGVWMLSNLQIFEGLVYTRDTSTSFMPTGHAVETLFTVNQATPVLFLSLVVLLLGVLEFCCKENLEKWGFTTKFARIQVDEDLPDFFEAIKSSEKDWALTEHYYYKENYGMNMIAPNKVEKLERCDYV